jgi:predicted MFS family arabinose efflux permease
LYKSFFASGVGSVLAAIVATRLGIKPPFVAAVCLSIASVWILWIADTQSLFFAGIMVFALAWNLGSPYRMALATRADTTGRFSTFVPAMQTLGAALGPAVAGLLVVDDSFFYVYVMSTVAWLLTVVLFFGASLRLRRDAGAR